MDLKLTISRIAVILPIFLFYVSTVASQTKAVTVEGDTIYVYKNGTWSYEKLADSPEFNEFSFLDKELHIDTLSLDFKYSKNAKRQVTNADKQFIIKYDESKWKRVPPASLNEDAEFAFQSRQSDIWCVVIFEETPIDVDKLLRIAKKSMEDNTGSEVELLKTELRKVNGSNIMRAVMKAAFSGISFTFDSYYFSDEKGSVQFTTWASNKVWKRS